MAATMMNIFAAGAPALSMHRALCHSIGLPISLIAGLLWVCDARGAMVVEGYNSTTAGKYDRYLNDPSFIGTPANWPAGAPTVATPYPWTGIGRGTGGRW